MTGKFLSYRGQPAEAAALFESIAKNAEPQAEVDIEINDNSNSIAVTIAVNGYMGFQYYYYVIKQNGN